MMKKNHPKNHPQITPSVLLSFFSPATNILKRERVFIKKMLNQENFKTTTLRWGINSITRNGFTVIEILLVLALIGVMTVVFYPSVMNTQEKRLLENTARDVLTTLQQAKFQAVRTKANHRVNFMNITGGWVFAIEKENDQNQWKVIPGFIRKRISSKFNVKVNFPDQAVIFSPLGLISNFSFNQNSIIIQSQKLKSYDHPDQRIINVFVGGSIAYVKSQS